MSHLILIAWLASVRWAFVYHGATRPVDERSPPVWADRSLVDDGGAFSGVAWELLLANGLVYVSPDAPVVAALNGLWVGPRWTFANSPDPSRAQTYGLLLPTRRRYLHGAVWTPAPWVRVALPCWVIWPVVTGVAVGAWRRRLGDRFPTAADDRRSLGRWRRHQTGVRLPRRRGAYVERLGYGVALTMATLVFVGVWVAVGVGVFASNERLWGIVFPGRFGVKGWSWVLLCVVAWLAIPTFTGRLAFRTLRWRRVRDNVPRCVQCGYNLTGNVSGVCPECGRPTKTQ